MTSFEQVVRNEERPTFKLHSPWSLYYGTRQTEINVFGITNLVLHLERQEKSKFFCFQITVKCYIQILFFVTLIYFLHVCTCTVAQITYFEV